MYSLMYLIWKSDILRSTTNFIFWYWKWRNYTWKNLKLPPLNFYTSDQLRAGQKGTLFKEICWYPTSQLAKYCIYCLICIRYTKNINFYVKANILGLIFVVNINRNEFTSHFNGCYSSNIISWKPSNNLDGSY